MYKAIQAANGEEIIILHPAWRTKIERLREMDHADLLVCQGCGQPLRVKAGEIKRPHFAHKHLKACSFGNESPEILLARAVWYEFLLDYFHEGVTLEKVVGSDMPRLVDCWVDTASGSLAYWIVDAGIKLEPREAIIAGLASAGCQTTYLMLYWMLNEEKKLFHSLLLSPTERAFLQKTPFDEMLSGTVESGQSIHYLDAEQAAVTTYRNLVIHHRPNWYKGLKKYSALSDVLLDRNTGGLIHPGEDQRLQAYHKHRATLETRRKQFSQRETTWEKQLRQIPEPLRRVPLQAAEDAKESGDLQCVQCGQLTSDYWATLYQDGRKVCRCRACLENES